MATTRVLKLACSDDESSCVLLHISPRGSKPLDLRLEATEGAGRYIATLKHDRVASLQAKNSPISEQDWKAMLVSILNQQPLDDIHAAASIESETSLSITIRKQVQGITQRLGTITLKYDMSENIELFEWCDIAAQASANGAAAAAIATSQVEALGNTVKDLQSQLDELIQVKDEDETALLLKFRDLLNEKKVKIRQQQKILDSTPLSTATALTETAEASPPPLTSLPTRKAAPSRPAKRKASKSVVEEDSSSGGVVEVKSEPEDTEPERMTEDNASTASDDNSDDESSHEVSRAAKTRHEDSPLTRQTATSKKMPYQPPPRRTLPFANRKSAGPATATTTGGADEETDSDDEL